jgi:glycosyltransferase involved in cell wall biosynthesis
VSVSLPESALGQHGAFEGRVIVGCMSLQTGTLSLTKTLLVDYWLARLRQNLPFFIPRRVLLLSPLADRDPPNGDVTYTEQLLRRPPPGVSYVTYAQALREGTIEECYRRRRGESVVAVLKQRQDVPRLLRETVVNRLRRRGLLFREPFRFFRVNPQAFDLVHAHVFTVGLIGSPLPLAVSNSVPLDALYLDAYRQPKATVAFRRWADRQLAMRTGLVHSAYGLERADVAICLSNFMQQSLLEQGVPPGRLVVVPPTVEASPQGVPQSLGIDRQFTVGFIGDFDAKGGNLVLEAHQRLRASGVDATLTVVGSEPRCSESESRQHRISWLPRQSRSELLKTVIPSFTVFAYPTRFDGLPSTLLEVMAAGIPPIVSSYRALPEVVAYGEAGLIVPPNDPAALFEALRILLDGSRRARFGQAARQRIAQCYSAEATSRSLERAYSLAIDNRSRRP